MNLKKIIMKHALMNAVKFGKAHPGAVIGKVLSEMPELREKAREVNKDVLEVLAEISSMKRPEQEILLQKLAPDACKKKKRETDIFAFLKVKGNITTAFPPEPSKYPHIGHAKAILVNYELAKRHNGKFILRFEDTNPILAKDEFYKIHLDNYAWLGVKPDRIEYASDYMHEFMKHAECLVKKGKAYVCSCPQEKVKESRMKGIACKCREKSGITSWEKMQKAEPGSMSLRLKIDLKHKNSAMRDPSIMRIIDHKHPRLGSKHRIWPTYDFENSIMDGIEEITYRLRSKEFEMRNELQRHIQSLLGFKETNIYEFARFNLEGVESSGRIIREKIKSKELTGWDDPSLTTLVALRRRGFIPEAIKNFVLSTGITKAESVLTWNDLEVHNRKLLDAKCNRYFFVEKPRKIIVKGAPEQDIMLKLHPEFQKRGFRELKTKEEFYIAGNDYDSLEEDKLYRLMDCLNFTKKGNNLVFDSLDHAGYKEKGERIMHWLPLSDDLIKAEILMPDKRLKKGLAEPLVSKLKSGDEIQFERVGFCRVDDINRNVYKFWFSHR